MEALFPDEIKKVAIYLQPISCEIFSLHIVSKSQQSI